VSKPAKLKIVNNENVKLSDLLWLLVLHRKNALKAWERTGKRNEEKKCVIISAKKEICA